MDENPDDFDMSRRGFMIAGSTSLLALDGDMLSQTDFRSADGQYQFQGVADLVGPADAKPEPGSDFFTGGGDGPRRVAYAYRYQELDGGSTWFITEDDDRWSEITMNPETQVDEVRVAQFASFFNHTFARPGAPDNKNWVYDDTALTKDGSEIELASTTTLETNQRGNYPPGSEAIPGAAARVTATPTAGRADWGYFTDADGVGAGADSTDDYVFVRGNGTEQRVYRSDWNGYVPDSRLFVSDRPVIVRFPHLFYGGGDLEVRALVHGDPESELRTLHRFTPDNVDSIAAGPPISQPNLPVRFESASLSGGALRANACHYEFGEHFAETRVNGEHFTDVSVGTSGWTPLLIFQKRSGWEMVNVKPFKFTVSAANADAKLGLQLSPDLSGVTASLPANTSSDETAVEVLDATIDADGERRWVGYATSGQGNSTGAPTDSQLTFNLPAADSVALVAQGVGGTAELSGAVGWEEYF